MVTNEKPEKRAYNALYGTITYYDIQHILKLTLVEYDSARGVLRDVIETGAGLTCLKAVADYFKRIGFCVAEPGGVDGVNYKITLFCAP